MGHQVEQTIRCWKQGIFIAFCRHPFCGQLTVKLYRVERIFYTNFACPMCALLRILIERSHKFSARRIQMLSTQYLREIILTYNLFIVYVQYMLRSNPEILQSGDWYGHFCIICECQQYFLYED